MSTKLKDHLHTYARSKTNKYTFRCIHPDCSHYTNRELLRGKRVRCRCGVDFVLPETITASGVFKRAELKCEKCLSGKKDSTADLLMQQVLAEQIMFDTVLKLPTEEPQLSLGLDREHEMELELVPGDEIETTDFEGDD